MDYACLQSQAADMLSEFGQQVILTSYADGGYNVATASVTRTTTTTVTNGVVMPVTKGGRGMLRYGVGDEPGTDIVASDQELLLPGDITEPSVNDTAQIGGKLYSIIAILPINPGGTPLVWDCIIRGVA